MTHTIAAAIAVEELQKKGASKTACDKLQWEARCRDLADIRQEVAASRKLTWDDIGRAEDE
jgi:hypothetical protein